uniref:MULE transposase domain-containing protein n=1 Tax=Ditylenchus dipsaci TaxID=166011 RepID=A0A915DS41_9BILA
MTLISVDKNLREITKKRQGVKPLEYKLIREFNTKEEFKQWFEAGECKNWKGLDIRDLQKFCTENYVCKFGRSRKFNCRMKLRVRQPQSSLKVLVEVSKGSTATWRSNKESRKGIRAKPPPSMKQIANYKHWIKKERKLLSLADMHRYAQEHSAVPCDTNAAFVLGFRSAMIRQFEHFCLVWSTPRLWNLQESSDGIQVDATHKLTWLGFPILVCGFSDANRKYFGTCIALSSNEDIWGYEQFFQIVAKDRYVPEILMGDGDQAISTAAENIWPGIKRGMCKAHMKMNLRKKLGQKAFYRENPVAGKQISSDVRLLEQASSTKEFLIASAFLQQEWSRRYASQLEVLKVCNYFVNQWILSPLNGWYEGFSNKVSQNNGLESRNGLLKRITFRKKLSLSDFFSTMESTLNLWSARPEEQNVAARPTVTPALYRDAFIFKTRDRPIQQVAGTEIYILQTSDCEPDEMVSMFSELCNSTFDDWSRYKEIKESICVIQPSAIWEDFYCCSCLEGIKKRLCPHSVMVMCEKRILVYRQMRSQ